MRVVVCDGRTKLDVVIRVRSHRRELELRNIEVMWVRSGLQFERRRGKTALWLIEEVLLVRHIRQSCWVFKLVIYCFHYVYGVMVLIYTPWFWSRLICAWVWVLTLWVFFFIDDIREVIFLYLFILSIQTFLFLFQSRRPLPHLVTILILILVLRVTCQRPTKGRVLLVLLTTLVFYWILGSFKQLHLLLVPFFLVEVISAFSP